MPAASNTGFTTVDDILVALNQKTYTAATPPNVNPTLALTNYGFDWSASAFNTLTAADAVVVTEMYAVKDDSPNRYKT